MNSIQLGKKPLSSMSPTLLIKNGKPFASIETGGMRIIATMALLISNLIDLRMDVQTAIEALRFYNCAEVKLNLESRIPPSTQTAVEKKGHELQIRKPFDLYFGGELSIIINPESGELHGGVDPRRDGIVLGF
ncbi:gamma-glutamyltransferase family protein [bacterium]|nr:gamma-glutamyltransferase family protein [bacterium]